jgi:anthranilate phosphoribosyltransferase
MSEPHPFARFVAILGRGKSLSRSLTIEEAEEAMAMILDGAARPEQVGAFLMLLRVKEETPDEIAGFVRACRKAMALPAAPPRVDVDWSSYAGKRRQLPWFLLAARALSAGGWRVFMHGVDGHTAGRVYTGAALRSLGLPIADDFVEAAAGIEATGFAYLPLGAMSPVLEDLMNLRSVLGLRSPVHTLARMLNPFAASVLLQGVFHPAYLELHRGAAARLGQPTLAAFRGEGGEIERRPNKACEVLSLQDGVLAEERWPALLPDAQQEVDEAMDLSRLGAVWRGESQDDYAVAAIVGTLAIALRALGAAREVAEAEARAAELWRARPKAL